MTNKEYLVDVFHSNEERIERFKILIESHKILIETNNAACGFSIESIKNLRQTNENLIESIEILRQTNEKIKREIEGEKVIVEIGPLEENYGETAIRCNYCKKQHGCPILYFDLVFRQKCCSLHKLPVDYSRVKKFPKEVLTGFLSFSN